MTFFLTIRGKKTTSAFLTSPHIPSSFLIVLCILLLLIPVDVASLLFLFDDLYPVLWPVPDRPRAIRPEEQTLKRFITAFFV